MARKSCLSGSKMYHAFCCNINMKPQQFQRWGTHYLRTFWSHLWKSPRSLLLWLGRPWPAMPLNNVNLYINASHSLYWTQCAIMVALCNSTHHYIFAMWFLVLHVIAELLRLWSGSRYWIGAWRTRHKKDCGNQSWRWKNRNALSVLWWRVTRWKGIACFLQCF